MVRELTILLATALSAGLAMAATPFGGDDTGFVPPDKATLACENSVAKAASKYGACVVKCHISRAGGKLADDAAEDACETANAGKGCGDKFGAAIAKIAAKCPGSCATANGASLRSFVENVLDGVNGGPYCDSTGTPFGGDDTGYVPPDKTSLSCGNSAAKALSKYAACVIKCHVSRAAGKLADDPAEDACETANAGKGCGDKYNATIAKLATKCPGSCAPANGPAVSSATETNFDAMNALIYCKSPSGAFLDE